jgi:hypothetical protein
MSNHLIIALIIALINAVISARQYGCQQATAESSC